jgi:hypothetical protein
MSSGKKMIGGYPSKAVGIAGQLAVRYIGGADTNPCRRFVLRRVSRDLCVIKLRAFVGIFRCLERLDMRVTPSLSSSMDFVDEYQNGTTSIGLSIAASMGRMYLSAA